MKKPKVLSTPEKALLTLHRLYAGVYARVAQDLGVDPSYVSRVARGEHQSEEIEQALIAEIIRIEKLPPKFLTACS
jgi:hypothetical protein